MSHQPVIEEIVEMRWNAKEKIFAEPNDGSYPIQVYQITGFTQSVNNNSHRVLILTGDHNCSYTSTDYHIKHFNMPQKFLGQKVVEINNHYILGPAKKKSFYDELSELSERPIIKCIRCKNGNEYANQDLRLAKGFYLCSSCNCYTVRVILGLE